MSLLKKDKKIPTKNYIILAIIFLGIIILINYFASWYKTYDDYERGIPIIRKTLSEINTTEFDHYIMENPNAVIYMCTASEDVCRKYEKKLKKIVINENLQDKITYLNLSDIDINQFVDNFNNTYPFRYALTKNYPAFVIYEEGIVKDILQGDEKEPLSVEKTIKFLNHYKVKDIE